MKQRFNQLDQDQNGFIDAAEIKAMMAKMQRARDQNGNRNGNAKEGGNKIGGVKPKRPPRSGG